MNREISFESFYRQYYAGTVSYCHHSFGIGESDAEDIVSDAFSELWRQWQRLDNHSSPILLAWIRKTVKYMAYSFNRKRAREPITVELGAWIAEEEEARPSADHASISEETAAEEQLYHTYLVSIRQRLSPKQRRLFDCVMVEHHDISTAAYLLGLKENTVKVGLRRLRAKLRRDILPDILKERNC